MKTSLESTFNPSSSASPTTILFIYTIPNNTKIRAKLSVSELSSCNALSITSW